MAGPMPSRAPGKRSRTASAMTWAAEWRMGSKVVVGVGVEELLGRALAGARSRGRRRSSEAVAVTSGRCAALMLARSGERPRSTGRSKRRRAHAPVRGTGAARWYISMPAGAAKRRGGSARRGQCLAIVGAAGRIMGRPSSSSRPAKGMPTQSGRDPVREVSSSQARATRRLSESSYQPRSSAGIEGGTLGRRAIATPRRRPTSTGTRTSTRQPASSGLPGSPPAARVRGGASAPRNGRSAACPRGP